MLFVAAFWRLDPFTAEVIRDYSFSNFETLWDSPVYRDIALRTIAIAAAVTLIDAVLAFPIAFYMAKVASPRMKGLARRGDPDAALGELPGEGLRLADHPPGQRPAELAARARSG